MKPGDASQQASALRPQGLLLRMTRGSSLLPSFAGTWWFSISEQAGVRAGLTCVHDRLDDSGHPAEQLIAEHRHVWFYGGCLYSCELGNLLVRVPEDSAHRIQEREYCG
jgi:hypothetical protein